jgi:4-amino-4-deoxy-L-arabinose transferase-like glycosyltransferase
VNAENSHHKDYALGFVILVALFLTLPWLDRPFQSRGEPREALVAQSMLMNDIWISPPAYNGDVPSKPPFNHWLISLASLPGGEVTEFTSRLPSAIAMVLFSAAFYLFLIRRTSQESALLASLILLSSFEWFRGAVTCRVDTILSTSLAGSLLALFAWRERGRRGFPFLAAILITCAALTKGPIGVALPLAIFALFEFLTEEKSVANVFKIGLRGAGIAVPVIAVVSLWYIAGYMQRGDAFIDKIYYENFARLTSSMEDEPHKHAAPYMFLMLALGLLPWTIVWIVAAVRSFERKNYTLSYVKSVWARSTDLQKFAFVAAAFIFLFFCIPSSKRSVYIMPAYPFIAILAAESLTMWGERAKRLMEGLSKVLFWFAVVVTSAVFLGMLLPLRPELSRFSGSFIASLSMWRVGLLAPLFVWFLWLPRELSVGDTARRFAVGLIGAFVIVSITAAEPAFYQLSPRMWLSSPEFASRVDLSKQKRFYSFGSEAYSSSFYLKKPFFSATPGLPVGSVVFVEEKNIDRLKKEIAPNVRELTRYASGLEPAKKTLVVVEVLEPTS